MAQTLESIKGGGGSIKVGTTGTIGSLMTRELESLKNVPAAPVTPRRRAQMASVSVPCGTSASKVLQPSQSSSNEASSSSSNTNTMEDAAPQKNLATSKKPKSGISKNGRRVPPMISLDGISTPAKETWFLQAFRQRLLVLQFLCFAFEVLVATPGSLVLPIICYFYCRTYVGQQCSTSSPHLLLWNNGA